MTIPPEQRKLRIEKDLDALPVLPGAVVELLALDPDAEEYPARLAGLIEREPSLAVRVLSAANSVGYGPEQPIRTIPQAITRVGARRAGQMFTASAVMRVFAPRTEGELDLWRHALQAAVAAREIARTAARALPPNEAYLIGLLHDVGRLVMFEHAPESLRRLELGDGIEALDLLEAERAQCGYDHCEAGWRACQALGIPADIGELIRSHHEVGAQALPGPQRDLFRAIQIADRLSHRLLGEPGILALERGARVARLERDVLAGPPWEVPLARADTLEFLLEPIAARSSELTQLLGLRGSRRAAASG